MPRIIKQHLLAKLVVLHGKSQKSTMAYSSLWLRIIKHLLAKLVVANGKSQKSTTASSSLLPRIIKHLLARLVVIQKFTTASCLLLMIKHMLLLGKKLFVLKKLKKRP
jgi:hypothetical protein